MILYNQQLLNSSDWPSSLTDRANSRHGTDSFNHSHYCQQHRHHQQQRQQHQRRLSPRRYRQLVATLPAELPRLDADCLSELSDDNDSVMADEPPTPPSTSISPFADVSNIVEHTTTTQPLQPGIIYLSNIAIPLFFICFKSTQLSISYYTAFLLHPIIC